MDSFENNSQLPLIRSANEAQHFPTISCQMDDEIKASLSERTAMTMERLSSRPTNSYPTITSLFRPRTNLHRPFLFRRPRPKPYPQANRWLQALHLANGSLQQQHFYPPSRPTSQTTNGKRWGRSQCSAPTERHDVASPPASWPMYECAPSPITFTMIMEHLIDHLEA